MAIAVAMGTAVEGRTTTATRTITATAAVVEAAAASAMPALPIPSIARHDPTTDLQFTATYKARPAPRAAWRKPPSAMRRPTNIPVTAGPSTTSQRSNRRAKDASDRRLIQVSQNFSQHIVRTGEYAGLGTKTLRSKVVGCHLRENMAVLLAASYAELGIPLAHIRVFNGDLPREATEEEAGIYSTHPQSVLRMHSARHEDSGFINLSGSKI